MKAFIIYVTTKDREQARKIGRLLVESRAVACVNIIDGMNSMYVWQGKFQDDHEAVMIAKTTEAQVGEVIKKIRAAHSYECPCIVAWPIDEGYSGFLEWIAAQVA
jgi:periplasmic divalent cation tolerance protein